MSEMNTLSIIIPAYERVSEVMECLLTLQATQVGRIQYIVSDDASPSVDLRTCIPPERATVVRRSENGGFAANANTGALFGEGSILVFCNQDVTAIPGGVSSGWDNHLLAAFDDPQIGIVGAKLLFPESNGIQSAGGLYDVRGTPYHRNLGWADHCHQEVNTPRDVSWVTGALLAIRRDLFLQAGGFDIGYRAYFEDVALCATVRELGYRVRYEPKAVFYHRVGTSGGSERFRESALRFRDAWVNSGRIKADVNVVKARYW